MLQDFGAVIPLDPVTGLVIGAPWMADDNRVTPSRAYEAAKFPIQAGYGLVTDAIMRLPPTLSVEFTLTDIAPLGHPVPGYRGRRYKLAADFENIEARLGPVRVWVRGYPPLSNYAITAVTPQPEDGKRKLVLSVTLDKLNYTTLYSVPANVSPDLLAAGILPI
jgi:hypothetical protein